MSHVIAAVSTGASVSAIGIIRLSGDGCIAVADKVFTLNSGKSLGDTPDRRLVLGALHDKQRRVIDQCMAVVSRAPHSYTGEDTVEFHCHGSPAVLAAGLEALYLAGALPARRGEFTKRAFLNGKMDLTQAEAVIDLIEADTADAAANAAGQVGGKLQKQLTPIYDDLTNLCSHFHAVLDYPDEDIEDFGLEQYSKSLRGDAKALYALLQTYGQGRILRQGVAAAIVGKPNVGKSSLLNALAGFDRCIVTDVPGTTRDTVEETVRLGGVLLRLIDTAGLRKTEDPVERLGVERSRRAMEKAGLILVVLDQSQPATEEDKDLVRQAVDLAPTILVLNKADLPRGLDFTEDLDLAPATPVSAKTRAGLEDLGELVAGTFPQPAAGEAGAVLTNARQAEAARRALESVRAASEGLALGITPDAVLTDVEGAMAALGELTGRSVREDVVERIFARFCVGK